MGTLNDFCRPYWVNLVLICYTTSKYMCIEDRTV